MQLHEWVDVRMRSRFTGWIPHIIDALIFLPRGPQFTRWLDQCALYCHAHAYRVLAVVGHWDDIAAYLHQGFRGVVVVVTLGHLPPDRLPRIEAVDDPGQVSSPPPVSLRRPARKRADRR